MERIFDVSSVGGAREKLVVSVDMIDLKSTSLEAYI